MLVARIQTLRGIHRHAGIETDPVGAIEEPEIFALATATAMPDYLAKCDVFSGNDDRSGDSHKQLSFVTVCLSLLSPGAK
jgi:hypothetical protein